ncbi:MAG: radical SAM protein [Chlorobiota bacterium]|nr:radical SAM protein [Chlorobiota bacterium]QQS66715.1 MAG: radical SAM protein [Chlorobiota bacterium]
MIVPLKPRHLKINELFVSIQGEGTRAGLPCFFIRLQGCGLRCSYCDTPYALDHRIGGEWKSFDFIKNEIMKYNIKFVEFTGGEPLEQSEVYVLMNELLDEGYEVAVETGGHINISNCDKRIIKIMDLKTPDSLMMKKNFLENINFLSKNDEVKFVCSSIVDYEWSKELIINYSLIEKVKSVLISPVFGKIEPVELVNAILNDGLNVRFQLQMHKFIWHPETRGV